MRILVISDDPWDVSNSFGNTLTNLFKDIDNIELAHIFCKYSNNLNPNINQYYLITEKLILKNLILKKISAGNKINISDNYKNQTISDNQINFIKRNNKCFIWHFIRDIIWSFGNWKNKTLNEFLDNFKPDLIYFVFSHYNFVYYLAEYILKYSKCPVIGHITDDFYSKQYKCKDFGRKIYKSIRNKKITNMIKKCEFVDTFTYLQKNEYEKIFNVPFKIRYKYADIKNIEIKKEYNNPLIFLYTGNIGNQRWINLVEIGKILDIINRKEEKAVLNIYSATPLTYKMKREFDSCKSLHFMSSVSGEAIQKIQSQADVLIHTESFDKKEIAIVRMSLSTKIIDYLAKGKCVIAYGSKEVASIDYFIQNNCGLVIDNPNDLFENINNIIENKNLISEYGQKALDCVIKNHNKEILHKQFYEDLCSVINKK